MFQDVIIRMNHGMLPLHERSPLAVQLRCLGVQTGVVVDDPPALRKLLKN